ncbi:MAG TPA: hypothetical protein VFS90_14940 [Pyrinomonadaceae bacterium]|nr:hypothetical protein [Pyrinomonadaceae bacterium]
MLHHLLRGLIIIVFIAGFASLGNAQGLARPMNASSVVGTWSGESICAGNRAACKNEIVVYRFEPVSGKSTVITLLADKIIKGKRVPMYKLDFQYDEATRTLSCDFTQGHTRGTWEYRVTGDSMEGTGIVLAGKSVARRVKVKRVREDQMPAAPDRYSYGP